MHNPWVTWVPGLLKYYKIYSQRPVLKSKTLLTAHKSNLAPHNA